MPEMISYEERYGKAMKKISQGKRVRIDIKVEESLHSAFHIAVRRRKDGSVSKVIRGFIEAYLKEENK
jgi:hypothetical protein